MVNTIEDSTTNPWQVGCLNDFNYLCCPECDYRTQHEMFFEHHAIHKHPLSIDFFTAEALNEEYEADFNLDDVKSEFNNEEYSESDNKTGIITNISKSKTKAPARIRKRKKADLLEENNDIDSYDCQTCSIAVTGLCNLGLHLKNEHNKDSDMWQCPSCDRSFPALSKLKRHVTSVHLNLKVKCPKCETRICESSLNTHMLVAHEGDRVQKPFKCEQCDFSSHALKYVKAHVIRVHKTDEHRFLCDRCDKKFCYEHQLKEHIDAVHDKVQRFMCEKCGKGFNRESNLAVHKGRCWSSSEGFIKCEKCDSTFTDEESYLGHFKMVHFDSLLVSNMQFMCDECPNAFDTKRALQNHITTTHTDISKKKGSKKCEYCGKAFMTDFSFREHVKVVHEKSTPFKCDQCDKSFGTKAHLKDHTNRLHTNLPCPLCKKTFSNDRTYHEHIQVDHEKSTPHECDQCLKRFGTIKSLNYHRRKVHRRVKCAECGQEMCNSLLLERHKAKIHGTKPSNVMSCPFCPLFYKKDIHLQNHVQNHHSEQVA